VLNEASLLTIKAARLATSSIVPQLRKTEKKEVREKGRKREKRKPHHDSSHLLSGEEGQTKRKRDRSSA
jgi:hypothetical protein